MTRADVFLAAVLAAEVALVVAVAATWRALNRLSRLVRGLADHPVMERYAPPSTLRFADDGTAPGVRQRYGHLLGLGLSDTGPRKTT